MSAGLFALLDDVAVLAKAAAASIDDVAAAAGRASVKATGVVVDDTAVTPRYVQGIAAERELPIIRKIAVGSLRNKLLFILPAAVLLSQFVPWLVIAILMVGGCYLSFEGVEKLYEALSGHAEEAEEPVADELQIVSNAVRTDFILSAEIMVIALNEVTDEPFLARAAILAVVAVLITVLVYGVVALIVKMDDVGLSLSQSRTGFLQSFGRRLVAAMPRVLSTLSTVGIAAMIWVGGHILLFGSDELGVHGPYALLHDLEHAVADATGPLGGVLGWLTNTVGSALVGLVVGAVVVLAVHQIRRRRSPAAH